ncbi:amidohydrolase family protein [Georgenia daeguensis]|uniref:Amidohydrolase family protein n=1 Tax=Georgenia daeguensis TaxID=908355 RepID=A0ABP8EZB8_9MICO
MIVDAHAHAWERWPYEAGVPATRGDVAALLHEMDAAGVDRALVVCATVGGTDPATANPDNNTYVARAATAHPDRLDVLADVDSRWTPTYHTPGAADRLERTVGLTDAVGVSHYLADDVDGWFSADEGREFLARAADLGALLSIHATPPWFGPLAAALREVPDLRVLLHHQGHVTPGSPTYGADLAALADLAQRPGVYVKVSGFHYLAAGREAYPYPGTHRVLRALIGSFGSARLLWGSDFPVARRHLTYGQSLQILDHAGLRPAERADVLGRTAARLLAGARRHPTRVTAR